MENYEESLQEVKMCCEEPEQQTIYHNQQTLFFYIYLEHFEVETGTIRVG